MTVMMAAPSGGRGEHRRPAGGEEVLGGEQIDALALLGVGAAGAALLFVLGRSRPLLGVTVWIAVVCLVPYWLGVAVVIYLPPATALSLLFAAALLGTSRVRWTVVDTALAAFIGLVVVGFAAGYLGMAAAVVAGVEWGSAYVLGRLVGSRCSLPRVYTVVGLAFVAVSLLAVVEFVLAWNPFVLLARPGPLYTVWGDLQERGGILRAEGAFGHSIALGTSVSLALPLLLASPLRRSVRVVGAVVLLAATVVTFSRLGIACAMLSVILSVLFLRADLGRRLRGMLLAVVLAGVMFAMPFLGKIFDSAGQEAQGSAEYRGKLIDLVPGMQWFGTSDAMIRSPDGVMRFGSYRSIDSAIILGALTYGIVPMLLLVGAYLVAVVVLITGGATPPLVAVVAQLPALTSVALITQYAAFLWFICGLAVAAHVSRGQTPDAMAHPRSRPTWNTLGTETVPARKRDTL